MRCLIVSKVTNYASIITQNSKIFAKDVNHAISGVFPKGDSFPYKSVHVLLLSWEEDDLEPPCADEIEKLREVFEQRYRFNVDEWRIPSDPSSHTLCGDRLREFVRDYDHNDRLLIIYYAGHGRLDDDRQCVWYWSVTASGR